MSPVRGDVHLVLAARCSWALEGSFFYTPPRREALGLCIRDIGGGVNGQKMKVRAALREEWFKSTHLDSVLNEAAHSPIHLVIDHSIHLLVGALTHLWHNNQGGLRQWVVDELVAETLVGVSMVGR